MEKHIRMISILNTRLTYLTLSTADSSSIQWSQRLSLTEGTCSNWPISQMNAPLKSSSRSNTMNSPVSCRAGDSNGSLMQAFSSMEARSESIRPCYPSTANISGISSQADILRMTRFASPSPRATLSSSISSSTISWWQSLSCLPISPLSPGWILHNLQSTFAWMHWNQSARTNFAAVCIVTTVVSYKFSVRGWV